MSGPAMFAHLLLECLPRQPQPREPESELVMENLAQNEAFELVGREDGILAFIYLYQALQIVPLVRPGDHVLDLGCGPANQLVQVARLNPFAKFTGLDASTEMLARARQTIVRCGVSNVEAMAGDMTTLAQFSDASFDCVISTMSLHHLPDESALGAAMRSVRRVLKPGGGLYLIDFGRLRWQSTQRFFAEDRSDIQPEQFTCDYFNSMRAAFSIDELSRAVSIFDSCVTRYSTALAPFMVIFKSEARRNPDEATMQIARELYLRLTTRQRKDFGLYTRWLRAGGLKLPFLLD